MTYETAIEIYDTLDDDLKAKEIYAHFGLAVYYAQVLEQQSINMIAACKQVEGKLTKAVDVEVLWDEYDLGSRTFGKLINEIKGLYKLSDEDSQELKAVLKLRNYIAHDYFRFNAELFYSEPGQKRMIKDLINFQEMAKSMDIKLIKYLKIYMDRIGITDQHIDNIMGQTKEVWENKIIDDNHKTIKK